MNSARFLVAVLVVVGAALAACSGNFGSGTTPPNGLLPSGNLSGINPTPSPTPNSASNIVTYGSIATFQQLPTAAGYGGAIAFPVPSPKPSGFADIAIGATLSIVAPSDAPDLNLVSGKGKKGVKRDRRARALAYVTLTPTHDATLTALPQIAIDVPRDIVTIYRENEFGIALYNAGNKDTTFKLAVADLDTASPPPTPSPNPSAPPPPTAIPLSASPSPSPSASASAPASAVASRVPVSGASAVASGVASAVPSVSPTLPPQRIVFAATQMPFKMTANRPIVFAIYALPVATPAPAPRKSGAAAAAEAVPSGSPGAESPAEVKPSAAASGAAPAPSGSASAAPSASVTATASASPNAAPAASATR